MTIAHVKLKLVEIFKDFDKIIQKSFNWLMNFDNKIILGFCDDIILLSNEM